ncbi:MAG: energy transducer TonB [Rikenellaceae bacterium]
MSSDYDDNREFDLPFESDRFDLGEWVYTHRVGLCITIITYLLVAIAFLTAKITLDNTPHTKGIMIDLQELAELERQRDELKKSVEELQQNRDPNDWESVQNRASNENALDERVRDDRNTDVQKLLDDAAEFQRKMAANRETYESGVAEAAAIKDRPTEQPNNNDSSSEHKDSKVKGNVTVSYSLNNPVRHAQRLVVPAYLCEGGGQVVINIAVSHSGEVVSAEVASGGDRCMQESALSSARASKFDVNTSAPVRHSGTITYIFIPQ